jgi:hypothetical protein
LFESDGKGSPRTRVKGVNLIHSEKISANFYDPDGKEIKIHVIFQIWSKYHTDKKYMIEKPKNKAFSIYSLSDGGTPSSTRNKKMLKTCDVYLPSTCYGKENMKCYDSFDDLPDKRGYGIVFHENKPTMLGKCKEIDWSIVSFLSTNSAYNLRSSLIASQFAIDNV